MGNSLPLDVDPFDVADDQDQRHEKLVTSFGRFLFWLRNWTLDTIRHGVAPQGSANNTERPLRECFQTAASLSEADKCTAIRLAEAAVDTYIQRLCWMLGDEGTDSRIGEKHAYRFRVVMEIVDLKTREVVFEEAVNRGGRFFGSYFGKWLNRFSNSAAVGSGSGFSGPTPEGAQVRD